MTAPFGEERVEAHAEDEPLHPPAQIFDGSADLDVAQGWSVGGLAQDYLQGRVGSNSSGASAPPKSNHATVVPSLTGAVLR